MASLRPTPLFVAYGQNCDFIEARWEKETECTADKNELMMEIDEKESERVCVK